MLCDPHVRIARPTDDIAALLRLNDLVIPLYKLIRIRVAHINIPQEYLPLSADELLAQINAYRATYS